MAKYIDFKQLASTIAIGDVADHLNLKLKATGKELRGKCPACNSNDDRALHIVLETNSYRCYAAQVSVDCISLYAHVTSTGMYHAAKALAE